MPRYRCVGAKRDEGEWSAISSSVLSENPIVMIDVQSDVSGQALPLLRRAPRSSKEPVDIGPEHRRRVIEIKERIKAPTFELALADDASAPPLVGHAPGMRELAPDPKRVAWVLIARQSELPRVKKRSDLPKKRAGGALALVDSFSVFFAGNLGEQPLRRHRADAKSQDLSATGEHDERNAHGQALGDLKGFHLIELNAFHSLGMRGLKLF